MCNHGGIHNLYQLLLSFLYQTVMLRRMGRSLNVNRWQGRCYKDENIVVLVAQVRTEHALFARFTRYIRSLLVGDLNHLSITFQSVEASEVPSFGRVFGSKDISEVHVFQEAFNKEF